LFINHRVIIKLILLGFSSLPVSPLFAADSSTLTSPISIPQTQVQLTEGTSTSIPGELNNEGQPSSTCEPGQNYTVSGVKQVFQPSPANYQLAVPYEYVAGPLGNTVYGSFISHVITAPPTYNLTCTPTVRTIGWQRTSP
jgi:hypothetical protein